MNLLPFRQRSLKTQVYLSFFVIILILLSCIGIFFFKNYKNEKSNTFLQEISKTANSFSNNYNNFQSFVISGFKEPQFYLKGSQFQLVAYNKNLNKLQSKIDSLKSVSKALKVNLDTDINAIEKNQKQLKLLVGKFTEEIRERGYKDFGLVGVMRKKAHALEREKRIPRSLLLQLRRQEKDYIIRGEKQYLMSFKKVLDSCYNYFNLDDSTIKLLQGYSKDFTKLSQLNESIGIAYGSGLFNEIELLQETTRNNYASLVKNANNSIKIINKSLNNSILVLSLLLAVSLLFLSYYFEKKLTVDILTLKQRIQNFLKSNFKETEQEANSFVPQIDEVRDLFKSYKKLKTKLSKTINNLEKSRDEANSIAEYKSTFLANMSHEMRTPLNGILGVLQILENDKLNSEQSENLEIARSSANHLLRIINMILNHTKIEVGKLKLESIPFNLKEEVYFFTKEHEYEATKKGLKLNVQLNLKNGDNFIGDHFKIRQILSNLLSNAIKFTEKGHVTLKIKTLEINGGYEKLLFSVSDTGIGFSQSEADRILKPFEQSDLSITREYGGTGLGLTITSGILNEMNTKLDIQSKPQEGSVFSFVLKLKKATKVKAPEKAKVLFDETFEGKHILIAEDNIINQKLLEKILHRLNISCDIANNGIEAVELYKKNYYDLILMDLNMPEMDGVKATEVLKITENYQTHKTPIIAVTACAFDEDKEFVLANGMDDFIPKPISLELLKNTLKKFIKSGKMQKQLNTI